MINTFDEKLISILKRVNHGLHALLAIALLIASLMIMWEFSLAVVHSVHQNNLAHGFLQALGTLFTVWTLSSLISAEINYIQKWSVSSLRIYRSCDYHFAAATYR